MTPRQVLNILKGRFPGHYIHISQTACQLENGSDVVKFSIQIAEDIFAGCRTYTGASAAEALELLEAATAPIVFDCPRKVA